MYKQFNFFLSLTILQFCLLGFAYPQTDSVEKSEFSIHDRGYWEGKESINYHCWDPQLALAIANFFLKEGAKTLVDFGCGMGHYSRLLIDQGFECDAYDGNPLTPSLTKGIGKILDLSIPFNLGKNFDWVLSLEVGEHLPPQYETIFIENLVRHATHGIVLSWALPGQGGEGHFNERPNDYIIQRMSDYGFYYDEDAASSLRKNSDSGFFWFKNTIMVFRR